MRCGYIRISAADKDSKQQEAVRKAGCQLTFIDENVSGGLSKCPKLLECLKRLQAEDVLIIWRLDKLARNLHDLLTITENLHQRGIHLLSLSEPLSTQTADGRVIFNVFKALHDCERNQLITRTQEGVLRAQARGIKRGPKLKLSAEKLQQAKQLLNDGETHRNVADLLKVHRTTLTRNLAADLIVNGKA